MNACEPLTRQLIVSLLKHAPSDELTCQIVSFNVVLVLRRNKVHDKILAVPITIVESAKSMLDCMIDANLCTVL